MKTLGITKRGRERLAKARRIQSILDRRKKLAEELKEIEPVLDILRELNLNIMRHSKERITQVIDDWAQSDLPEPWKDADIGDLLFYCGATGGVNPRLPGLYREVVYGSALSERWPEGSSEIDEIRHMAVVGILSNEELERMKTALENPRRRDRDTHHGGFRIAGILSRAEGQAAEECLGDIERIVGVCEDAVKAHRDGVIKLMHDLPSIVENIKRSVEEVYTGITECVPTDIGLVLCRNRRTIVNAIDTVKDKAVELHLSTIKGNAADGPAYR